jgi:hypothetical protein
MAHKGRRRPSWKKSRKSQKPAESAERDSSQRS